MAPVPITPYLNIQLLIFIANIHKNLIELQFFAKIIGIQGFVMFSRMDFVFSRKRQGVFLLGWNDCIIFAEKKK